MPSKPSPRVTTRGQRPQSVGRRPQELHSLKNTSLRRKRGPKRPQRLKHHPARVREWTESRGKRQELKRLKALEVTESGKPEIGTIGPKTIRNLLVTPLKSPRTTVSRRCQAMGQEPQASPRTAGA